VLELTYTAWDLEPFAKDCGWSGPPCRWDEERRFLLRSELDAAFFHLYLPTTRDGQWERARVAEGAMRDEAPEELAELKRHFPTPREAVAYIMDTFPILRRREEEKHGDYRTKRIILEIYDEMAEAMRTGIPYKTRLDPPPADPSVAHLPKGGIRPEGQPYSLVDLLHVDLPGETVPIRLLDEFRVEGCDSSGVAQFRFLTGGPQALAKGEVVIIRHPKLRRGDTTIPIAAGKIVGIQDQYDPVEKQSVVLLVMKASGGLTELKLRADEWKEFRPLCVLVR
jgi:hypothetical protein